MNGSVHQVAADAARPDQTTLSATLMEHVVIMPQVELPQELIEKFEKSGFCPHDAVRGRPETGTAWNTLEIEYDPGSESSYSGTSMFYVCHWNGKTTKAERPWGEMSGKHDGEFIKAVVDWFQSMTQARS